MIWKAECIVFMIVFMNVINPCECQVPAAIGLPNYINVFEGIPIGTELFRFNVSVNVPYEKLLVYTSGTETSQLVSINQTDGNYIEVIIFTKVVLNRDNDGNMEPGKGIVDLQFAITDKRGNSIGIQTRLYIDDINDNHPELEFRSYTWEIPEGPDSVSETFTQITATDPDAGDNGENGGLRYFMEPLSQSETTASAYREMFIMDDKTGAVSLQPGKELDYETNSYYQFNITVRDQKGDGLIGPPGNLIIRVLDVQDSPPFFTRIPYRRTITENIPMGTSVIAVTATDGDSGVPNMVNYTILNGKCSTLFNINSENGDIATADEIDRDTGDINDESGVCILTVMAQEILKDQQKQYGDTTAITDVTITVKDINDNPPTFGNTTYIANVSENTPRNVPITLISSDEINIFDADQGENAMIELSLSYLDGTACNDFSISPSVILKNGSALIKVNNVNLLDYETINITTFLIIAHDKNASQTATVTLSITDMNDNNPQFDNSSYELSVMENTATNVSLGIITATDRDSGEFGEIEYSLSGGNDRFKVNPDTGRIITNCQQCTQELDREKIDIFYMTYTATDKGGRSNSTSLIVHVIDENDNAPVFNRQEYFAYIDENDSKYNITPVITLEATDRDKPGTDNSNITYEFIHLSETNMFCNVSINNEYSRGIFTGVIHLNSPVDYEKLNNQSGIIEIIVQARDNGIPNNAANTSVIIHVQDVNDNDPIFDPPLIRINISENAKSEVENLTITGNVTAIDADRTSPNNKVQYFIKTGAMDRFAINLTSGKIYVQIGAKLDRESIPNYNITIIAIDQGSPPRTGTTFVDINIIDVNDELPVFNSSDYANSVYENETASYKIITCEAFDNDTEHDLKYSLYVESAISETGENINKSLVQDYFDVDETNGKVYVKSELDREVATSVRLTIEVEDVNAYFPYPQKATASLTITLLDVNDNHPEFVGAPYSVNVSENAQNPTILLTISATDKDADKEIRYDLINDVLMSSSFQIDPSTGVLRKVGQLDRENVSKITLNISATDSGTPQLSTFTILEVTVLDFNDNEPFFVNFTNETTILENITIGTNILHVTADDHDIGQNANLTFFLEDNGNGKFSIDRTNGNISVIGELDRETTPSYELRIKVQDNPIKEKEEKFTIGELKVLLKDVNDNHPIFSKKYYFANVVENTDVGVSLLTTTAFDADETNTNNSKISYKFSNDSSPSGLFRIGRDDGNIYVNRSLVGHVGSYVLGLVAEDHGEPVLRNTSVVNITVLDVNLNNPIIANVPPNHTIQVYECVKEGSELYRFNYTDADSGINAEARFNISEIDDVITDTFEISADGILKLKQKLNALVKDSYRFQVQATDSGTPQLSSEKIFITVKVIDVDDHLPTFINNASILSVPENRPVGEFVGVVTAVDRDHDSVQCYNIIETEMAELFAIGKNNGRIVTRVQLDYENKTSYTFSVKVTDCTSVVNISQCANITHSNEKEAKNTTRITVNVIDVNDNPPVFKSDEISVGMRRVTEVNTTLDLSLKTSDYIMDKDTDVNGKFAWVFTNAGNIQTSSSLSGIVSPLSGVMKCPGDEKKHIICVSGNGSLINNKYYKEDISGYLVVPVNVSDVAGSDTVNVKIFLIGNSQILIMTVLGEKELIAETKNDILKIYSDVTGYKFVYDWLEDHKTPDGRVETFKTDIYFHVVDKQTDRVLSADEAIKIVDGNYEKLLQTMEKHRVLQVVSSQIKSTEDDDSVKTVYILAAIVAVLALTVAIIIYVSLTTRNTYKRKLKAATVKPQDIYDVSEKNKTAIPGSNVFSRQANPLLDAEIPEKIEYDNMSMGSQNSLDTNSVGTPRKEGDYNQMEEKEVRMDMFIEDEDYSKIPENPLEAALKQYDMQNMQNKQENDSTDGIVSPNDMGTLQFENKAYLEELESTEI